MPDPCFFAPPDEPEVAQEWVPLSKTAHRIISACGWAYLLIVSSLWYWGKQKGWW